MKKRFSIRVIFVLAALLGVLMLTTVTASAALKAGESRVTSARLNIRKTPSTSASVLGSIPKGTFVTIKSSAGNNWYKVTYSGTTGYVSGSYLVSPFDLFGDKYSKYVATSIWMRSSPKQTSSNKIRVVPTGSKVFVIAKVANANWYKIYYGGKVGYVIGGYFKGDTKNTKTLAKGVNLRSSPVISNGNKICVIPAGAKVVVLSKYSSKWYKVRYGSRVGYIAAGYFTTDKQSSSSTRTVKTAINLRSSRSLSASIIRVIPSGAKVTIVASYSNNWYKVKYNGSTGYIKGGYFA